MENNRSERRSNSDRNNDFINLKVPKATFSKIILAVLEFLGDIVRTSGLAGLVFICGFIFFWKFGTLEQKKEFIDKVFLGKGIADLYWVIIICVLAMLVCWAQRYYYGKQLKEKQKEINRLIKWKMDHQEKTIDKDLPHAPKK